MISFTVFHKEDMMFYYSLMCLYHFRCISLPSAISPIKAHRVSRIKLTNHRVTAKFLSVCLYHFRCISLPSAISPIKAHRVSRIKLTNHRVTAKFLSVRVKLRQRQMSAWMKIKILPALRCFLFLKTQNFNSFH